MQSKETILKNIFEKGNEGRVQEALVFALKAEREYPNDVDVLVTLSGLYEVKNDHIRALEYLFKSVEAKRDYYFSHFKIGDILYILMQSNKELAYEYIDRWVALAPENIVVQVHSRTLKGEKASYDSEYTRLLFDNFADSFDMVLSKLHYSTPFMVAKRLERLQKYPRCILDVGCGTGLCADYLRKFSIKLAGVDISEKMLKEAEKKSLYNKFYCQDIEKMSLDEIYDVAVAADVMTYFEDFSKVLACMADAVTSGGYIMFSIALPRKRSLFKEVEQEMSARYNHSWRYAKKKARALGLRIIAKDRYVARKELGRYVRAMLVTLQKP